MNPPLPPAESSVSARADALSRRVKESNIRLHDVTAEWYETGSPTVWERMTKLRIGEALGYLFRATGGGRLLDVGCGTGNLLDQAEKLPFFTVGSDISGGMLKICAKRHPRLLQADADSLPFRAATFSAITCYSVLHHLYDQERLFRECFRVLKEGGVLYCDFDPNALSDATLAGKIYRAAGKLYTAVKRIVSPRPAGQTTVFSQATDSPEMQKIAKIAEYHRHYGDGLTPARLRKKLEAAGFRRVDVATHDEFSSLSMRKEQKRKLRFFADLLALILGRFPPDFLPQILLFARKEAPPAPAETRR